MSTVLIAVTSITIIGAACAAILSVASKMMHVDVDERIAKIQDALPGTNCGACGFPGCAGYASALIEEQGTKTNLCPPGGAEAVAQISEILGVEAEAVVSVTAVVHCAGDSDAQKKKMKYHGVPSCYAAEKVFGGESACAYGCLGYGDCLVVCPSDAICMVNGLAKINMLLCTGCALCVGACPRNIITMQSSSSKTHVVCSNIEKGAVARKKCARACLACKRCIKDCEPQAIKVENNLAVIEYDKCTDCGKCAEVCPVKCIEKYASN